ncbi:Intramolecular chaperone auto-processing domain containing protein [uncultured Caudovirales phage]|uniref:Intramolecular chaperone auto-processing domain containing protein n=1 Tax=uncultured Caudovirales phage TaxID=2100421 RepID=A0A6J5NER7_9CAUD|nr:Intramolecular chaperone auto-processing domain containing protein [uncultured Caudovirales phage]
MDYTSIKVGQLPTDEISGGNFIPHEVAGVLKKATFTDLAAFIGANDAVGFRAVSVANGGTLPATETQEFILVGAGTYNNVGGGSTITVTGQLNALVSNGTYWFVGVEIPIDAPPGNAIWGQVIGTLSNQTDLQNLFNLKADLVDGKVPSSQLPSYVDDVIEVANYAALPVSGETGKIYITIDTEYIYRWSGSVYIRIADEAAAWGTITGTLSNQTDLQNALDAKEDDIAAGTTAQYWRGDKSWQTLNKAAVGLNNVDNTSDLNKPISTATQTALDAKFDDPIGDTTQYIAGDGSLISFPIAGQAGTVVREVRNASGATITKGTIVYINGASGNKATIAKALATGDSTSAQTFGFVQADIANNANGYVVCLGDLIGINTSGISVGTQLYLSSTIAGEYTTTKQVAPAHLVYVGVVTRSHATLGQIEVKIQNGYELDEIHDVLITSKTNKDFLVYESSTDLWKNKSLGTVIGGTSSQFFKGDGSLDSNTYATTSQLHNAVTIGTANGLSLSNQVLSLGLASSTLAGALSSADWNTFNAKQPALSGSGFVKISGTTISYDNSTYLTSITSGNVTTALGYTPYNATNPSGYITGITSGNVTTALGYTPYNATNPNGYTSNTGTVTSVSGTGTVSGLTLTGSITGSGSLTLGGTLSLTSGNVTSALGFTPYNATNPSGYITSSGSISGNAATATTATNLSGGTANATSITGTSISVYGNGASADPYGTMAVTEPANTSNYSYYGLTRAGNMGGGFGLTGTTGALGLGANSYWFGSATSGAAGVMGSAWIAFNSASFIANGDIRSTIFYDSNNTGYYVDPASTSSLNVLTMANKITLGSFSAATTNSGEAWIGRASDRVSGTMTVQLGGGAGGRVFEVVDYAWTTVLFKVDSSGNATASGDVTAYSDKRIKENIITIDNALDKVLSLRGVTYNRIDSDDKSQKIGVIAQEIQEVLPQVVHEQENGLLGVSYGNITAVLIEAIKEQQTQIEELKQLVNQLIKK